MISLTIGIVRTAVQARGLVHVRLGQRRQQLFQAKLFGSRERRHAPKLRIRQVRVNCMMILYYFNMIHMYNLHSVTKLGRINEKK